MRPYKRSEKNGGEGRRKGKAVLYSALLCLLFSVFILPGEIPAAEGVVLTEQEAATEKFLSSLEGALAQKFFDYRKRPVIRVAVFDFTDGEGNVVKAGSLWAEKIARRLYPQPQFDVVSRDKVGRYLSWDTMGTVGKLDTASLRLLQRRINTMDPGNGINALITGEVKKGVGRSLQVQAYLVNFEYKVGEMELENNLIDVLPIWAEIPLPTEQALQEASEIVVRGEKKALSEGRLVILANTRGYPLVETDFAGQFNKDEPFPWGKVPYALAIGREESTPPKQIEIGVGRVPLSPVGVQPASSKGLEYSFLHGKFATNEVYFDAMIPAMGYPLVASFVDLKNNQSFSQIAEVQVHPGTTTVVVISIFVPSEKERLRSPQAPRINVFQYFGKQLEILPRG